MCRFAGEKYKIAFNKLVCLEFNCGNHSVNLCVGIETIGYVDHPTLRHFISNLYIVMC